MVTHLLFTFLLQILVLVSLFLMNLMESILIIFSEIVFLEVTNFIEMIIIFATLND